MATLTVEGLGRTYPRETGAATPFALREVAFRVPDGHIAALIGPSGAGKTSLLRLIAGLDRPDSGRVLLDGTPINDVPPHQRGIGLMFQELALFPHLNVRDNVAFGLRMAKWKGADRRTRVAEMLALVQLADRMTSRVDQLSGGERQRVALARALAPRPAVLLLDEPLGAIDEERKHWLRAELRSVLQATGTTALIVSHDLRDAVAIADDVLLMDDGLALQSGPLAEVMTYPATPEVASMLGYVTLVAGEVDDGAVTERGVGEVLLPPEAPLVGRARVMAHPAALLAVPGGRRLGCGVFGVVAAVRPDGPLPLLEVILGERRVEVRWEWDPHAPPLGTVVELAVRMDTLRYYGSRADDDSPPIDESAAVPAESSVEDDVPEPDERQAVGLPGAADHE